MIKKRTVLPIILISLIGFSVFGDSVNPSASVADRHPDYQILVRSLRGDTDGVRRLLLAGVDPNTPPGPDDRGMTALMFAGWRGHDEIISLLIAAGANVNATSTSGQTSLMYAAFGGHAIAVQTLLAARANPNITSNHGESPLMVAFERGHLNIARVLIPVSDVTHRSDLGETPLQLAIKRGDLAIVEAVLLRNPPLEAADSHGRTPLMNAARLGHTRIVIRLLNKGALVNARDSSGRTALSSAGNPAVSQVLRQRGGTR